MERPYARSLPIEAKLKHLLEQGASHDRALELLVDVLIERGPHLPADKRGRCVELIISVASHCEAPALTIAARRLAVLDFVPKSLLLALVRDSSAAAEPIPTLPGDISPEELAAVVATASPAHLQAIAARENLDPVVTTSLIARGDREAIATFARNRRAKISRASFDDLVAMSQEDADLRTALCRRHDLPEAVIPRFWPGCADAEKARLLVSGFSGDAAPTAAEPGMETGTDAVPPQDPAEEEEAIKLDRQLAGIILQYSDISNISRISRKLAERAGVDEGIAFDLVCGSYERGLVLLARAANIDEWTFLQLICARMKLTSASTVPHRALRAFREYPRDEAKRVLLEVIALREAESFEARQMKAGPKKREVA